MTRFGVDGTHHGDPGWDTLTDVDLWPFPNEERIRDDFRSVPDPPDGAIPTTSNPQRGFCAEGYTLTTYIWESLGTAIPDGLYQETKPSAPMGLRVVDESNPLSS